MHESGTNVPQNQRARFTSVIADELGTPELSVPMISVSGAMTINDAAPPASEFDDGLLYLGGVDSDDTVLLGNTHDGAYQVNVIPGDYHVYYAQQTSGGVVPDNKYARVLEAVPVTESGVIDVDIQAVPVSGALTIDGAQPPSSVYEDGRLYLRNTEQGDSILLGSTHGGNYAAIVVPGSYELIYSQEAGGQVPANQSASLGLQQISVNPTLNIDIPVNDLTGQVLFDEQPAPDTSADGGQLYLRSAAGDSVLLGNSFDPSFATKLVSGTYGIYYRSTASIATPQNENGRVGCITLE